ncbi:unnamed protein product [Rotaria sordida]|uniref:C2 domain-containing protein n=3 Tax=Rotaria sordida TaxID=392033 RepID=A0A815J2I0_9BILA|nr:unnamed protein product [Rotaria sordida]
MTLKQVNASAKASAKQVVSDKACRIASAEALLSIPKKLSQNDSCLTPTIDSELTVSIEEYHQLTRIIMLHELEDAREINGNQSNDLVIDWNGTLNKLSNYVLAQFCVLYNVSTVTEAFIKLLVIMELRCSKDYTIFISQDVIKNYLKLFMNKVQERTNVKDVDFTEYEKIVFKEVFYLFIDHYKQRTHHDASWFLPLKDNLPNIQSIFDFYSSLFNNENNTQFNNIRDLLEYIKKIDVSMSIIHEYEKLFSLFNISYIKICFFQANSAGDRLAELTKCLLTNMTDYFQTCSKPMVTATSSIYGPNLIQSSSLLLNLYLYLQKIIRLLQDYFATRDLEINPFTLRLIDYCHWFSPIMEFLLEGVIACIRQIIERAAEYDIELVPYVDIYHYSDSSTMATISCERLCQEWATIEHPDITIRYTALFKLTNTICEQCQCYTKRIARQLSENKYFSDVYSTRSFIVSKKLCILINDIENVKKRILLSLPDLLNFTDVINNMIKYSELTSLQKTELTLKRLISTAEDEMNGVIKLIFDRVATLFYVSLKSKIFNYYEEEKLGKADCMTEILQYIDEEILHKLYRGLESIQYPRIACAIHMKTLQCLKELLPLSELPEFFERVLRSFNQLTKYFDSVCLKESYLSSSSCDEVTTFRQTLETYALSTDKLQLRYFLEIISQDHSPHEYSNQISTIFFRSAYDVVNGLAVISVSSLRCQDLPKINQIDAPDSYVLLELLPSTLYPEPPKEYRTHIQKRTFNPAFNELFEWNSLPLNVIRKDGAVLRLSVWNKHKKTDDFIGECFVRLITIESLKTRASLRDIPVSQVLLRRPYKNTPSEILKVIRNRATCDVEAAVFLKQRIAVLKSGNEYDN